MILSGGMGAWAAYLTPLNSGAGPMMIYAMRRAGVPLPLAVTTTLMSFIATVLFFAIAGPLAILLGAGRSLGQHGNVLGLTLYDLFLGSLGLFVGIGVVLVVVILFPGLARGWLHRLAERLSRRSRRVADRIEALRRGHRRGAPERARLQQPRGDGWPCSGPRSSPGPRTPTSCWPATSRCARSASRPTSWTCCWCRR